MALSDISSDKLRALADEVDAAASLLRHGQNVLKAYRFAAHDADTVFVCLAGGVEKLLKLSAGMRSLHDTGRWPSREVMKDEWGHNIVELDRYVRALVGQHRCDSTVPGLIAELLATVDADPHIKKILSTLGAYAQGGRFYNLDHLASAPQPHTSPRELWEELHRGLVNDHPELLNKLASPGTSKEARAALNDYIINSFAGWQELITRAWRTGVLGQEAKRWAPQLMPPRRC
ncbi:hypothetical protein N8J89_12715 [Crossiella sp. CA-258035]|uniref:hypothetical protein n=1 Tax=Crossiella sp. CA-258035 TaxID=2981138 RepID=UPI0024BD0D27|nr:hypothetical protein [Crossiella sp. CA-258035]WHT21882.1 hypothetical protein N8J89_12715 [Crossiella sp. CA-258035]